MTKDEALKLALEALERGETELRWQAITALKEALAQPEQKPVAWRHKGQPWEFKTDYFINLPNVVPDSWEPLYTTPPQRTWVGLTDEELQPIADEYRILFGSWVKDFARAIEAKLKEKNGIKENT